MEWLMSLCLHEKLLIDYGLYVFLQSYIDADYIWISSWCP
jgi:hypothetical protein